MSKRLFTLLACLFVVMVGFGITVPVLPFYVERLALAGGASRQSLAMHVSLLTAVYPLPQLLFAPLWGNIVHLSIEVAHAGKESARAGRE